MRVRRGLLSLGNDKLSESIHHFDLPAVLTCPGRTPVCERHCYATKGRFRFNLVRDKLAWNLEQARRGNFADRMVKEVRRKGVLVLRLHCSGDFLDQAYAEKWLNVMRKCPRTRFYFYSRSWRVPEVAKVLEQMATLANCRAWYSLDHATGRPASVPPGVRLAYLQVDEADRPELCDLMFRVKRLRRQRIPLATACPHETVAGQKNGVNCANCGKCWN